MRLPIGLLAVAALALAIAAAPRAAAADSGGRSEHAFARNAGVTVKGIRIGRHPDKLRIVLDATGPLNFDYRISEGGRTIAVLIPRAAWEASESVSPGEDSRIYRISFFPSPSGGGVLSILGRQRLGLSTVEQVGPEGTRSYRTVFDIPYRGRDAWIPAGGIMRGGKLLPAHRDWPPVMQSAAGRTLPVISRDPAGRATAAVSYAGR